MIKSIDQDTHPIRPSWVLLETSSLIVIFLVAIVIVAAIGSRGYDAAAYQSQLNYHYLSAIVGMVVLYVAYLITKSLARKTFRYAINSDGIQASGSRLPIGFNEVVAVTVQRGWLERLFGLATVAISFTDGSAVMQERVMPQQPLSIPYRYKKNTMYQSVPGYDYLNNRLVIPGLSLTDAVEIEKAVSQRMGDRANKTPAQRMTNNMWSAIVLLIIVAAILVSAIFEARRLW